MPRRLRDRLKELADREHRSLNGQLVAAVEEYVRGHPRQVHAGTIPDFGDPASRQQEAWRRSVEEIEQARLAR